MSTASTNLKAFLRACSAKRLKAKTQEWYEWILTEYCQYIEAEALRWDAPETLDIFFGDYLADRELSPHTIHGYYRALRRFFNWLEKRKRLPGSNPFEVFEPPKLPKRIPRNIEEEEVNALLDTIGTERRLDVRDRAIILFLWDTGMRATELCELEMADLDLETQQATIRDGKGEKDRKVSFGIHTKELVIEWLAVRGESIQCDHVFVNRSGVPFNRLGIRSMLCRRNKKAQIGGPCNPNAFRHGFAMAFLDNGGSVYNLQRLMGYASLRSTENYLDSTGQLSPLKVGGLQLDSSDVATDRV